MNRSFNTLYSPSGAGLIFVWFLVFQFIDLCILLGCDYCGTIKGIGPKRAIDLIRQHGSIEEILENIDTNVSRWVAKMLLCSKPRSYSWFYLSFFFLLPFLQKYPAPEDWLYKEARNLFLKPEVVDCSSVELKWSEPDEEGLIQFMCNEKQFRWAKIKLSLLCSELDSPVLLGIFLPWEWWLVLAWNSDCWYSCMFGH